MARRSKNTATGVMGRLISSTRGDMSVTVARSAVGQVRELWARAAKARVRAEMLQRWYTTDLREDEMPTMPDKAPEDLKRIRESATTPYARMGIKQLTQLIRVNDLRLANSNKSSEAWRVWQQNGYDGKQIPLVQAATKFGEAYSLVTPAIGRLDGGLPTARMAPYSARKATAFYRNDFAEWPELFLIVEPQMASDNTLEDFITFVDETYIHYMSCPHDNPDKIEYISNEVHGMDLTPVQRHGMVDLDGNAEGEIEPYIKLLKRIDQDTTDRLVIQRFGAWVVRTIAGMKEPTGKGPEAEAARAALETWLAVGDFMSSDSKDTKFGSIPATPMDGHLKARESDIRDYSAASGTPSYRTLGLSDNIGAEAIDAADKSLDLKADEYKVVLGEQYEAMMRLAGYAMGNDEVAQDYTSRVHWTPIVTGSQQSRMQALGIAASQLGIPVQLLWNRIDEWTPEDTAEALKLIQQEKEEAEAQALLEAALNQGGSDGNAGTAGTAGASAPAAAK